MACKSTAVMLLNGTRNPAKVRVPIITKHVSFIQADYNENGNKHTGCKIALTIRRWKTQPINSYAWTSGRIQGQGLALRLQRGNADYPMVTNYMAPFQGGIVAEAAQQVFDWTYRLLVSAPCCPPPIVGGDFDGHLGFTTAITDEGI